MNCTTPKQSWITPRLRITIYLSGTFVIAALIAGCAKMTPQGVTPVPGYSSGIVREQLSSRHPSGDRPSQVFPGPIPSLDEEVWIVARTRSISAPRDPEVPRQGSLVTEDEGKRVPLPLKHTDVQAMINGYIATVTVLQQYHNPFDHKIEAVYVFPLPENAAVNEFVMIIGERRIRGIIRERLEAEKIYEEAKRQGYTASLLTEERANIFTQSVANIEPGKQIDIRLHYFHTLAFSDGWHEFVFPMVVGPRFNPPGSTAGVDAVARDRSRSSGQKTEVQYLAPTERSGHDISLHVELQAAVPVEEVVCRSHESVIRRNSPTQASVALSRSDSIPNKDFVLRYRVGGDQIKAGLVSTETERGGFFTLMLYPPLELRREQRQPLELVFVLDCSGSMSGTPLRQAKAAVRRGLELLRPGDSFQLINFSMSASQLGRVPLEATPENVRRGARYLESLNAEGGTMMIEGIKAALEFPHDRERLRFVCFLTDGYIGNEAEILAAIKERVGVARIFSFGVGSSPNRYLMDSMARLGRGAVAYLSDKDDGAEVMNGFFERIRHPALTNIGIKWDGGTVNEIFPARIPDLFVGRALTLSGRFYGKAPEKVEVLGKIGGTTLRIPVRITHDENSSRSIAAVWARAKISDLLEQSLASGRPARADEVRQVALDFSLISPYTAFVAVDSAAPTTGAGAATVPVAVPVPVGVKYDTTVSE